MTHERLVERVQAIVKAIAGQDRIPDGAGPETPLGEGGYFFDSLDILEVILACEREFDVVFEAGGDLTADTLLSAGSLARLIGRRIAVDHQE